MSSIILESVVNLIGTLSPSEMEQMYLRISHRQAPTMLKKGNKTKLSPEIDTHEKRVGVLKAKNDIPAQ